MIFLPLSPQRVNKYMVTIFTCCRANLQTWTLWKGLDISDRVTIFYVLFQFTFLAYIYIVHLVHFFVNWNTWTYNEGILFILLMFKCLYFFKPCYTRLLQIQIYHHNNVKSANCESKFLFFSYVCLYVVTAV